MNTLTFQELGNFGRFGNQLFQIASTIGVAVKNGYQYAFPQFRFNHLMPNPLPVLDRAATSVRYVPFGYHDIDLPGRLAGVPDGQCTSLHGYLQSERYFEHCKDLIKQHFTFQDEYEPINATAVHVRRGDYKSIPEYHPLLGREYYDQAITEIAGFHFGELLFFSDEPDEVRKMYPTAKVYHSGDTLDDFLKMKSCRHFIIANSTYSWWAAWLGSRPDKKVIAPKRWFSENAPYHTKDLYPKEWILI